VQSKLGANLDVNQFQL